MMHTGYSRCYAAPGEMMWWPAWCMLQVSCSPPMAVRRSSQEAMMPKSKHKVREIRWLEEPEEQDYPAAESYLRLLYSEKQVAEMVEGLKLAAVVQFKAKDIFRASQLSLLGVSNSHVEKDRKKIKNGVALAPLLLVRDERVGRVVIADGYHRMCAIYEFDEDAWIHCKII